MPVYNTQDIRGYSGYDQMAGEWVYCEDCFSKLEKQDDYFDENTEVITEHDLQGDEKLFICDMCTNPLSKNLRQDHGPGLLIKFGPTD